jgi:3-methyladenine DNA glycosylase AlkD
VKKTAAAEAEAGAKRGSVSSSLTRLSPLKVKPRRTRSSAVALTAAQQSSPSADLEAALVWLKSHARKATRDGMARFGIPSDNALGVTMADIRVLAKRLGKNHALAQALWNTGIYEARMVASLVAEPARLTPREMDRWCREFDSWAVCDTVCFSLFDRVPYAFRKVSEWAAKREEFVKRAAFALLWALTVHDKRSGDEPFARCLPLVERAASDERHLVKKAVNMALRALGKRSVALNRAALTVARRLANGPPGPARWVGSNALKELTSASVVRRLAAR